MRPDEIDGGIDKDRIDTFLPAHYGYLIVYDRDHFLDETVLDHEWASWLHITPPDIFCIVPASSTIDEFPKR